MRQKVFNRDAVDLVKRVIGVVIDPVLTEKQKDAIQPESDGGLRRGKTKAKKLPAKRKRTALL